MLWKAENGSLKTKNRTVNDPVMPPLDIHLQECKPGYSRDTCTTMFIEALFTTAKLWKQPSCPMTNEWIKKMWYMYMMEFYSA
jgi:hypothetical protein